MKRLQIIPGGNAVIPLKQVEKQAIERALVVNDGNISHAARQLAITRAKLYRKIKAYNIHIENTSR